MRPTRVMDALLVMLTLFVAFQCCEVEAKETNAGRSIIYFTAKWCGPCQAMHGDIERLQRERYPLKIIDVDQNEELARRYQVNSVPVILLLKYGVVVDRIEGQTSYDRIVSLYIRGETSKPSLMANYTAKLPGGSGAVLAASKDDCLIGTAYHVVTYLQELGMDMNSIDVKVGVYQANGRLAMKRNGSRSVDEENDIALIVAPIRYTKPFIAIAKEVPSKGEGVWVCGFPKGGVYHEAQGKYWGPQPACDDPRCTSRHNGNLLTGYSAQPGNSGGPLFNSARQVIGIVTASRFDEKPRAKAGATPPGEATVCAKLVALHKLCQDTDYPFPPILPYRRKIEKDIEEAKQLPIQLPAPPDPSTSVYSSTATTERLKALEVELSDLVTRVSALEEENNKLRLIVDAAKQELAHADTEAGRKLGERIAAIETKNGSDYAMALAKLKEAQDEVAKAKAAADGAKSQVDTLTKDVAETKRTLGQRILDGLKTLPIIKQVAWLSGQVKYLKIGGIGLGVGILLLGFFLFRYGRRAFKFINEDIQQFLDGTDPLWLREVLEKAAAKTSTKLDDVFVDKLMDAIEAIIRAFYGKNGSRKRI